MDLVSYGGSSRLCTSIALRENLAWVISKSESQSADVDEIYLQGEAYRFCWQAFGRILSGFYPVSTDG